MSHESPGRPAFLWALCIGCVLTSAAWGCSSADAGGDALESGAGIAQPACSRVVATVDFGFSRLLDATVALDEETTAIEALESVATVETSYGGCFVERIDGVGRGDSGGDRNRVDWFYFVNGFLAHKGGCEYVLSDGDVQHWDNHDWRFRRDVSATLGVFPNAFVHGYGGVARPTTVVFEAGYAAEAEALATELAAAGTGDVAVVDTVGLDGTDRDTHNLVLVAGPDEPLVVELYGVRERVGLFTALEPGTLVVFAADGAVSATFGTGTGVIEAMQNPWNPRGTGACENAVLLVSGTDEEGVRAAANALIRSWRDFGLWAAAIVVESEPARVPLGG